MLITETDGTFFLLKARGEEEKANHDEHPKERSTSEGYWR